MTNLKHIYNKDIVPKFLENFEYKNIHQIPKLEKIVINSGLGLNFQNKQYLKKIIEEIREISGQHPIVTKAKKSISAFKLREGMPIGLKVTLRRSKMYAFFEKLFKLVFPRMRDFRGLSLNCFDNNGNYNLGISDQFLFPELEMTGFEKKHGFNITIVTTAKNKAEALFLLQNLGFPFNKNI